MTNPINLNKARKAKARSNKTQSAAENRVKFGRTKAEKQLEKARAAKAVKDTDAHKRD
jgi:hypothetical protein